MSEPKNNQKISLSILAIVSSARLQNGLRHGAYPRYRQYCTRRAKSIRKSEGKVHGSSRGKLFKKIDLTAEDITNERILQLPLVNSERYWAYAMELKEESVDHHYESRKVYHALRRLSKAVEWARKLKDFATAIGDDITVLEADAYYSTMSGLLALDKEDWENAFQSFSRSKTIYEKLGEVAKGSQKEMLHQRANENVQHIRYCEYNLSREGKSVEDLSDALMKLKIGNDMRSSNNGDSGAGDFLASKLDAVLAQARRELAHGDVTSRNWRNISVETVSDKIRIALLTADDKITELEQLNINDSSTSDQLDKIFTLILAAYDDAASALGTVLKDQSIGKSVNDDGALLKSYIQDSKLRIVIQRNLELIEREISKDNDSSSTSPTSLTAVVRLYEMIRQNLESRRRIAALDNVCAPREIILCFDALIVAYDSRRTWGIGQTYFNHNEFGNACLVFDRAIELANNAISIANEISLLNPDVKAALKSANDCVEASRRSHAASVAKSFLQKSSSGAAHIDVKIPSKYIPSLPPSFVSMPVKPITFNLASSDIDYPVFTEMEKESKRSDSKTSAATATIANKKGSGVFSSLTRGWF